MGAYPYPPAPPPPPPPGYPGAPPPQGWQPQQAWQVGEVISAAFTAFKSAWPVLVGTFVVSGVLVGIPAQVPSALVLTKAVAPNTPEYWAVYGVSVAIAMSIQTFFQPGLIRIWLAVARGQAPQFGDLFSGGALFFPLIAQTIVTSFLIVLGYVFCFVPGMIVALGLMFSQFFLVDAGLGPIEAMKESWRVTNGHKAQLFLLLLAGLALAFAGMLACCFGMYATFPIFLVSLAIVYVRITGRGPAGPTYGAGPFGGPPPGYYPPPEGYGPPPGGYGPPPGYGQPPPGGFGSPPGF